MARLSDIEPIQFREVEIPSHARCASFLRTLEADEVAEKPISKSPLEIVNAVLERGGKGLSLSESRQLPILMLQTNFNEFQPAFALEIIKNHSRSSRFWRMLFRAWLVTYNPEGLIGGLVVEALSQNQRKLPSHLQTLASRYPIIEKKPDFGAVVQALIGNQIKPDELRALGLNEQGEVTTRFAARMLSESARFLKSGSPTSAQLKNFRDLVAPRDTIHESVQMAAMIGLIMGSARRPAGEEIVEDISKLIGSAFDDPMVRKDRWPSVSEELGGAEARAECIEIVLKWQVFRSITLFFRIIEKVVETEHKHQFPIRRDFWLGYFDRGMVTDAWVVLGSKAAEEMRRVIRGASDEYRGLKWGKLRGGRADQCALLLRLGGATVMEFSHSGRVRMWGERDQNLEPPRLHRAEYQADELRALCPNTQMFTHDHHGKWRVAAASCIQKLTRTVSKL